MKAKVPNVSTPTERAIDRSAASSLSNGTPCILAAMTGSSQTISSSVSSESSKPGGRSCVRVFTRVERRLRRSRAWPRRCFALRLRSPVSTRPRPDCHRRPVSSPGSAERKARPISAIVSSATRIDVKSRAMEPRRPPRARAGTTRRRPRRRQPMAVSRCGRAVVGCSVDCLQRVDTPHSCHRCQRSPRSGRRITAVPQGVHRWPEQPKLRPSGVSPKVGSIGRPLVGCRARGRFRARPRLITGFSRSLTFFALERQRPGRGRDGLTNPLAGRELR